MIKTVQRGLKLNGTHQFLLYADDANILGRSTHTIKKNIEALVVASKEIDPKVHAGKTKYMDMSSEQNASQNYNIQIDNKSFKRVEQLKYLRTTLKNHNSIQEERMNRLKLGNACYHSAQNLLSYSLLSKNIKLKIYRTIILPAVLYGCETWLLTLREEHRMRVYENRVLRKLFGPKRDKVTGNGEYCITRSLMIFPTHRILFG